MTGNVWTALVVAETTAQLPDLNALGDVNVVTSEVSDLAESHLAALAAKALIAALDKSRDVWAPALSGFIERLDSQRSYLALADTLDVLLAAPPAVVALAACQLHDVLIKVQDELIDAWPLLAAARLEGALRIALTGAVAPYLILDRLTRIQPGLPDEYVERLPRLVGMALDRWEADVQLTAPLVAALEELSANEVAEPDAVYEVACRLMRVALREANRDAAAAAFLSASKRFFAAANLEEVRDDATIYGYACAAVAAFGSMDTARLREAVDSLGPLVAQRLAWHRGMNVPAWRQPRLNAEIQWLGLVIDLGLAAERLGEPSWLDSHAAAGQLARVYAAERSTAPSIGLAAVVRPVIENVVAERAILLSQLERTIVADREREHALPESADILLEALLRNRQSLATIDPEAVGVDLHGRIERLAPGLRIFDTATANELAEHVTDNQLAEMGTILSTLNRLGVVDHPVLGPVRSKVIQEVSSNPGLGVKARAGVVALLDATLSFVLDRYERTGPLYPALPEVPDIYRRLHKGDVRPHESALQREFYIWLQNSQQFAGRTTIEQRNVARGRVDILVRLDDIILVTEVKRELDDASRTALESSYIPQAAAYSGANVPVSQLLVLDLTDHSAGVPPLQDLVWTAVYRATDDASPQHVIATIIVGNRPSPSELAR